MKKRALYVFAGETIVHYGEKLKIVTRIFDKSNVLSRCLWVGFYFENRHNPAWYRFSDWVDCV